MNTGLYFKKNQGESEGINPPGFHIFTNPYSNTVRETIQNGLDNESFDKTQKKIIRFEFLKMPVNEIPQVKLFKEFFMENLKKAEKTKKTQEEIILIVYEARY